MGADKGNKQRAIRADGNAGYYRRSCVGSRFHLVKEALGCTAKQGWIRTLLIHCCVVVQVGEFQEKALGFVNSIWYISADSEAREIWCSVGVGSRVFTSFHLPR